MYWCQPPYMPPGGDWKRDWRVSSARHSDAPSRPHIAAPARSFQTARIDAWPAASISPSPFASTQLASPALQLVIWSTTACASGLGARALREDRGDRGPHQRARVGRRRGVLGAEHGRRRVLVRPRQLLQQPVDALRCRPRPSGCRRRGSRVAGLLFQLTSRPFGGSMTCGCLAPARKPFHSIPAAAVGRQVAVDALRAQRQPAGGDERDVLGVGVERVERLRRRERRLGEVARAADLPVRQLLEEDLVGRLAPGARAPLRERDDALAARHARVADHRAVHGAAEAHPHLLAALGDRAGVHPLHPAALALVAVARARAAAEPLGVRVDDVGVRRGERPGGRARPRPISM